MPSTYRAGLFAVSVAEDAPANGPMGFWVQRVTYLVAQDRIIKGRVKAHFSIGEHEAFIKQAIELRQQERLGA